MKAYVIERTGGPEVLQLQDVPAPQAGENEVKIRVKAFGLNRAELMLRAGNMGEITAPRIPGIEAVGEVMEDASGVFRPGQRVATLMGGMQFNRGGSYAQEVCVLRSNVIDLNDSNLSWEELAALPEAWLTIWGALDKRLKIARGESLLIRGATSSVGLAALLYAKNAGLSVIATTRSPQHTQHLYELGADHVVVDNGNIAQEVRRFCPNGADKALEIVGLSVVADTAAALRPFGEICMIGMLDGMFSMDGFNPNRVLPDAVTLSFFGTTMLGTPGLPLTDTPLAQIARDVDQGRLPSLRVKTLTFDEVPQAHRLMENSSVRGKLVVLV
ncbi:zinc-binding dehydrogenase [Enterobacillus tribolii]|uniref:NADPH:quinone reductase-like Zn-dependent oxidoreductase n=1 Tax=Enterobacillus tribolii TaxID=1487935 RepID=A0A370QRJ4_9GAMM|nr:zinc-binding dehydrogenase [Enterobacillus tribolii]MBW7983624.1 alcohol dehydrogenase [Enterobacillus tribolii]RDK91877.1 NADPH:quinone reductase-like Zn-dependent oxidoreductase [Enterobacillus tribolii]